MPDLKAKWNETSGDDLTSGDVVCIVGTNQEAAKLQGMGYRATTAGDVMQAVLDIERDGRAALICLNAQASEEFADTCESTGVPYARSKVYGRHDIDGVGSLMLDGEIQGLQSRLDSMREEAKRKALERLGVYDVLDIALQIASGEADRERVSTGLQALDDALGGGLQMGCLAVLGATSSTGKTTLALQIADGIAAGGRPVLFVTVEQGRHELVAKSISRLMRLLPTHNGGWYVASSADIQSTKAKKLWGSSMHIAFNQACADYSARIAPNMHIMELEKQPSTADIRKAAKKISTLYGQPPVVFVDYLQLLAPISERMSDKQAVDHNVMDLRHLARDLVTCVFVISSLNRASYSEGVTQEAFKESGSVEYSADVLLGMQPRGLTEELDEVTEKKQKREARRIERAFKGRPNREVEIRILKNRGGAVPQEAVPIDYSAICNLFTCSTTAKPTRAGRKVK